MTVAALTLAHVTVELDGRTLVRDASAHFPRGQIAAVVGLSGAGKSVLMKAALGLLPRTAGEVTVRPPDGAPIVAGPDDDTGAARVRQHVAFVHQDPAVFEELTVRENVAFALVRRRGRKGAHDVVTDWLERLGLASLADAPTSDLTPGGLRRVALARALCLQPDVLIVDEPTTGLDPVAARDVDEALRDLASAGSTLVVITHDVRSLETLRPALCWVDDGRVRYEGAYDSPLGVEQAPLAALLAGRPQ